MQETPKHYDLTWILPATLTEEEHKPINNEIQTVLQDNGATELTQIISLGKKKLAYPIGQHHHGSYYTVDFDLVSKNLPAINQALKLMTNIVRCLIISKSKLTAEELAKQESSRQKRVKTKEVEKTVVKEVKPKEASKISLADLDKKLDEILSDDNLNI